MTKDNLEWLRNGEKLTLSQELKTIVLLSIPAILSQITTVAMEYCDASMVGHLGSDAGAAIGLVTSTTWLINGITLSIGTGFSVQVAHMIGAKRTKDARSLTRHGLLTALAVSIIMAVFSLSISGYLPLWLGGDAGITGDASAYFMILSAGLPFIAMSYTSGGMLQCSGNMRIPGIINIAMCFLNVLFNAVLIFPSGIKTVFGVSFYLPGAGLGVKGAALGTILSEAICSAAMLFFLLVRSEMLHLRRESYETRYADELRKALTIALPVAAENTITGGAYVAFTKIVAPLGTVSIAANSFAITAEGLCYMPGYGISAAATTLTGQSVGARRSDFVKRMSYMSIALAMLVMTVTGCLMYAFSAEMISLLSPDPAVIDIGSRILRIEAFAEPFFAASIVTTGIFRGMGKTIFSTILNLSTMWFVRIPLAAYLAAKYGLIGVWSAMCIQLIVCGTLFVAVLTMVIKKPGHIIHDPADIY